MRSHEDHTNNDLSPIKETKIILKEKVEFVPPDNYSENTSSMKEEKQEYFQESQMEQEEKQQESNLKFSHFQSLDNNLEPEQLQKIKRRKIKSVKENYEYYVKYCQLEVMNLEMKEQMHQLEEEKAQLDAKIKTMQQGQNPESKQLGYKLKIKGQAGFIMKDVIAETTIKDQVLNHNLKDNRNAQLNDNNNNNNTPTFYNTNFSNSNVIILQSNNDTNLDSQDQNRILPVFSNIKNSSKIHNNNDSPESDNNHSKNQDIDADISNNSSVEETSKVKKIPKYRCPVKTCLREYYLKSSQQYHTNIFHPDCS